MNYLTYLEKLGGNIIVDNVTNQSETQNYRFVCVDLSISSKTRDNIFEYYTYLDRLVRDCQTIKKQFIKTLDHTNLKIYQIIIKLVTFYYDIFNQVFDIELLHTVLDEINNTDIKILMRKYQDTITISQRLWKKGDLRNPEKIMARYHDQYYNIMSTIKKQNINFETITKLKNQIDFCIDSHPDQVILKYLFGPKLWLHGHYLDHLQNIYYYLKLQDKFEIKLGTQKYFCFMQDKATNTLLNGMLINKNEAVPNYQEHIFIHHNLYDKLFGSSPNNISMYLHSYAYYIFSNTTQQITVFPLAVMYNIFVNHEKKGLITLDIQNEPLFHPLPDGFIYQPLICIGDGDHFGQYWNSYI